MEDPAFQVELLWSAYDWQAADLSLQHSWWTGTEASSATSFGETQ